MFKFLNAQIKKLTWIDFKLAGIYGVLIGLLAGVVFPSFVTINFLWYLVPAVLIASYIGYRVFKK